VSELSEIVRELGEIDTRLEDLGPDDREEAAVLRDRRHELRARAAELRQEIDPADQQMEDGRLAAQATPPR
jgi:uncharacterized coiled-coil DUF342 family protein